MKAWNFEAPAEAAAPDIMEIRARPGGGWVVVGGRVWGKAGRTRATGWMWGDLTAGAL